MFRVARGGLPSGEIIKAFRYRKCKRGRRITGFTKVKALCHLHDSCLLAREEGIPWLGLDVNLLINNLLSYLILGVSTTRKFLVLLGISISRQENIRMRYFLSQVCKKIALQMRSKVMKVIFLPILSG